MSEEAIQFHARFDTLLLLLDTDLKKLASDIGISKDTLYSMRSAKRTPSYDTLFALKSKYPMVNLDYLISGLGKPLLGFSEYIKVETKPSQVKDDLPKYNPPFIIDNTLQNLISEWNDTNKAMLEYFKSNTPHKN